MSLVSNLHYVLLLWSRGIYFFLIQSENDAKRLESQAKYLEQSKEVQ